MESAARPAFSRRTRRQSAAPQRRAEIIVFFLPFLLLLKLCENGKQLWIEEDIVVVPHFGPILELTWLVLCILTWWLLKGVHFQPFQMHEIKDELKNET